MDHKLFTETVTPEFAAEIETAEVNAWLDMYQAIPREFARQFHMEIIQLPDLVLTRCTTIPFIHFNVVKNLGLPKPATEAQLDQAIETYREAGVDRFWIYHHPHCQPSALLDWFAARGLNPHGGWERIFRDSRKLAPSVAIGDSDLRVEKVTQPSGSEWAAYIDSCYGLPTAPWLLALVNRLGWHHYMLRRGADVVAVRTLHIDHGGMGWLGIDAPVPGIMAPSFDLDRHLCEAIIQDGLALGVKFFVADIEAPTADMDTPAYRNFEALGFKRAYFRMHYRF